MRGPASSTTAEIYLQTHEQTTASTAPHTKTSVIKELPYYRQKKLWNNFLITFTSSLNVRVWKAFSVSSSFFIKMLSLLWKKLMGN